MAGLELSPAAQHWLNVVLVWLGFGTAAGLLARTILPTRRPAGSLATLVLGVVGSALGLLALSFASGDRQFNPISPLGLLAATGGALVLLVIHSLAGRLRHREEEEHET
jgi:uncharacterized membrane protein YeaQ/YmgE (transglycosylase-associated protein family)